MIKNTVINAELGYALATARHKDAIVICDANMPIPDGCNVIDVSLIRGVPTLEQTMCAILNDLVAERYEVEAIKVVFCSSIQFIWKKRIWNMQMVLI